VLRFSISATGSAGAPVFDQRLHLGYDVHIERFERPSLWHDAPRDERIAFARRRLCVGPERDAEIGAYLDQTGELGRKLVTLWWDTTARPDVR